jgi:hypothetical protein
MKSNQHNEVSLAIQKLGGDKVLDLIESVYENGLFFMEEASRTEVSGDIAYAYGFCQAIEVLRMRLIKEAGTLYDEVAEEFGDEHRYAAAAMQ